MRVYLSSRLRYRGRCREYAAALEAAGHVVTSRWLNELDGTPEEIAARDIADVRRAQAIIIVGHCGRNGGMMAEAGIAIERGLRILHVAAEREPREVFLYADGVEHFYRFSDALDALSRRKVTVVAA